MTPRMCSYAGCLLRGTEFDEVERWAFCRDHWAEHLALMAEEQGRPCQGCDGRFVSDVGQRRMCDGCRAERKHERQKSYKDRKKAS